MSIEPHPTDDDDGPDPVGLAANAARYLERTGVPAAAITPENRSRVLAAARELITALTTQTQAGEPMPGGGWISGPSTGGNE